MSNNIMLLFIVLIAIAFSSAQSLVPQVWVNRTVVTPLGLDSVFYEGAPSGCTTRVTLQALASPDTFIRTDSMDYVIACDLSGSMNTVVSGYWRITWSQAAIRAFLDSLIPGYDQVGIIGWTGIAYLQLSDTANPAKYINRWDYLSSNFTELKQFCADSLYINGASFYQNYFSGAYLVGQRINAGPTNTPLKASIVCGLNYLVQNGRPSIAKKFIVITDGSADDNTDSNFVLNFVDSIHTNFGIKTYTILIDPSLPGHFLDSVAARGGGKAFKVLPSFTFQSFLIDSIYSENPVIRITAAARAISSGAPLFQDVLGPDIHYVPGSYTASSGGRYRGVRPCHWIAEL